MKKISMTDSDMYAYNLVTEILNHAFADAGEGRVRIDRLDLGHEKKGEADEFVTAKGVFTKLGMVIRFSLTFSRERSLLDLLEDVPWWKGGKLLKVGVTTNFFADKEYEVTIGETGPDFRVYSTWLKKIAATDAERRSRIGR